MAVTMRTVNTVNVVHVEDEGSSATPYRMSDITAAGATGITTQTHNNFTTYTFNTTTRMSVDNSYVLIDPEVETLVFLMESTSNDKYAIEIIGPTGVLQIGREITANGATRYSRGVAVYHTSDAAYWGRNRSVVAFGGGTIEWYGGTCILGDGMGCYNLASGSNNHRDPTTGLAYAAGHPYVGLPGNFTTHGGTSHTATYVSNDIVNGMQLKLDVPTTSVNIDGITYSAAFGTEPSRLFATNGFNSASNIVLENARIQPRAGTHTDPFAITGIEFANNINDFDITPTASLGQWTGSQSQACLLTNVDIGSAVATDLDTTTAYGFIHITQRVTSTLTDIDFNPIQGVGVSVAITDDGNRDDPDNAFNSNNITPTTIPAGLTSTSDASGVITPIVVPLRTFFKDGDGTYRNMYYNNNGDGTADNYTFSFKKYEYKLDTGTLNIRSSSDFNIQKILLPDDFITKTLSEVQAMTGITITKATGAASLLNPHIITVDTTAGSITMDDVYDYWKYWFCLTDQLLLTDEIKIDGSLLDLGFYRLVFTT